jgi:hypothetical protein
MARLLEVARLPRSIERQPGSEPKPPEPVQGSTTV